MQQRDVDDTTTLNADQSKAWPPNTPDAREAEDGIFFSRQPNNYLLTDRKSCHLPREM